MILALRLVGVAGLELHTQICQSHCRALGVNLAIHVLFSAAEDSSVEPLRFLVFSLHPMAQCLVLEDFQRLWMMRTKRPLSAH